MVLHLLGKKSWNVYNSANVERVRRDEAEAAAREEAEEQRMQEEDAQRRIAVLRGELKGESATGLTTTAAATSPELTEHHPRGDAAQPRDRKRRRLRGEDETDREIRCAREDAESGKQAKQRLRGVESKEKDAPLQNHAGNIQLIPAPDEAAVRKAEKNAAVEAEKAKKRKRDEDQYTMRFSNAAGYQNDMVKKPWYAAREDAAVSTPASSVVLAATQGKDVWGNEDPARKERDMHRVSSNDPFAAMQHAQRKLKESERDREAWKRKQQAEILGLEKEERERKRREKERRRRKEDRDSLDGFSLDAPVKNRREREADHDQHRKHHHRRHGHRNTSRERARDAGDDPEQPPRRRERE